MARKTHTEAQARYDKLHRRVYGFRLHNDIDSDIIAKLASVNSMQGYIKQLIREDINRTCSVPKTEREENNMMTIKEIAKNWIENADTTPDIIDIETARQYISWMDPEQTPDDMTPEAFMAAWNDIVHT